MNGPSIAPSPGMNAISPELSGGAPPIVVVMGVAGCGKSSVGQSLATKLGDAFIEGDAHHPPAQRARST